MNENLDFTNFTNNQEKVLAPVETESTPLQDKIDGKRREMARLATDVISAENGGRPQEEIDELERQRKTASTEYAELLREQDNYYRGSDTGDSHDFSRPGDLR